MVTSKHTCGRQSALNWFILNSVAKDGDYTLAQVCLKISTAEIRLYAIQLDSNDTVAQDAGNMLSPAILLHES